MNGNELSEWIARQAGVPPGLTWPGPTPPPVTVRDVGPREGVSGPGNEPGLDDSHIVAEFRKPSGELVYLQKDNASTYERKGFVATGVTFSWDDWNVYAASIDKWRAVGNSQASANPPLFPGPFAAG
jgi:hypothetical protein